MEGPLCSSRLRDKPCAPLLAPFRLLPNLEDTLGSFDLLLNSRSFPINSFGLLSWFYYFGSLWLPCVRLDVLRSYDSERDGLIFWQLLASWRYTHEDTVAVLNVRNYCYRAWKTIFL